MKSADTLKSKTFTIVHIYGRSLFNSEFCIIALFSKKNKVKQVIKSASYLCDVIAVIKIKRMESDLNERTLRQYLEF